jgi:ADP-ribose pyrophosphatase
MPTKLKAPKTAKASKTKKRKPTKALKIKPTKSAPNATAQLLSSQVTFECSLFKVRHDKLIEPDGKHAERDVIRHNGSVVILAIDNAENKRDPWIVVERQYRHAANRFLWELPAGKLEPGEDASAGRPAGAGGGDRLPRQKWKPLVEYYASPGFLGESMKVFVAEGLVAGDAHPEDDEQIVFRLVKLSECSN